MRAGANPLIVCGDEDHCCWCPAWAPGCCITTSARRSPGWPATPAWSAGPGGAARGTHAASASATCPDSPGDSRRRDGVGVLRRAAHTPALGQLPHHYRLPGCTRGHSGARGWLDSGWPGHLRRSQQRWDKEPGRRARGPAGPSGAVTTARQPTAAWCGKCDERTRMLDFDGDSPRPCPSCKARCVRLARFAGGPGTGQSPLGVEAHGRHDERGG
jgi:hypothetical protein